MNPRIAVPLLLASCLALLSGCGNSGNISGSGQADTFPLERAEIARVMAQAPEVIDDLQFESAAFTEADLSAGLSLTSGGGHSLRWSRKIKSVTRSFEFAFADSDSTGQPQSAIVTIRRDLSGTFQVHNHTSSCRPGHGLLASLHGGGDDDDDDDDGDDGEHGDDDDGDNGGGRDSAKNFKKPLLDHWVRRVQLQRVFKSEDDTVGRWKVVATSAVEVTSEGHTIDIQSVHVASTNLDTTLTDPLNLWKLRRLLVFSPGEIVELTVTTNGDSADVVSLLSSGSRKIFMSAGGGVFTARVRVPFHSRIGHLGVNALTNETVFDPAGPYDSAAWILPFAVRGNECGDYLPRD